MHLNPVILRSEWSRSDCAFAWDRGFWLPGIEYAMGRLQLPEQPMPKRKFNGPVLYRARFRHQIEWMTHWLVSRSRLRLRQIESRYE